MNLISMLTTAEQIFEQALGRKVELFRSEYMNTWMVRFTTEDYRTPVERAVDDAWEKNRI